MKTLTQELVRTRSQTAAWKAIVYGQFYGRITDNQAHAQSVCTRPFLPHRERPGDEAKFYIEPFSLLNHIETSKGGTN